MKTFNLPKKSRTSRTMAMTLPRSMSSKKINVLALKKKLKFDKFQ